MMNSTEEEQPREKMCSCGGVDGLYSSLDELPFYCGVYLYLERPWSSSQVLSGKGANNGHFEKGQLVQAILTKVVFACQGCW